MYWKISNTPSQFALIDILIVFSRQSDLIRKLLSDYNRQEPPTKGKQEEGLHQIQWSGESGQMRKMELFGILHDIYNE